MNNVPEVDRAAFRTRLEELLRSHAVPLIPGSRLALLVNDALGGGRSFKEYFAHDEVLRLRTFIERHVPAEVVRATEQRRGSDIVFAAPDEASAVELAHDGAAVAVAASISRMCGDFPTGRPVSEMPGSFPTSVGLAKCELACRPVAFVESTAPVIDRFRLSPAGGWGRDGDVGGLLGQISSI
jgi:hypothetical protein